MKPAPPLHQSLGILWVVSVMLQGSPGPIEEPGRIERVMFRAAESLELAVESWSKEPAFFDAEGIPVSDHPAIAVEFSWSAEPSATP